MPEEGGDRKGTPLASAVRDHTLNLESDNVLT